MYRNTDPHKPISLFFCAFILLSLPSATQGQGQTASRLSIPPELEYRDPEIRALLAPSEAGCAQRNMATAVENAERAIRISDSRRLIHDRALIESALAVALIGQGEVDAAFKTFQQALQDAIDSRNPVLQADTLISLASQAQMKGKTSEAMSLVERALNISDQNNSLYERARALGELGRLNLLAGKTEEAARLIDQALDIDKLNGYKFLALHLLYRGYYLGLQGKTDDAIASLTLAKNEAISSQDAYSFLMAENAYAFGLIKKGRTEEAIHELESLKAAQLEQLVPDEALRTCLVSALSLPTLQMIVLEGLTNALSTANRKADELKVWHEMYSSSQTLNFVAVEAESAHKIADLNNQSKTFDEALKYYAIASELYKKLDNAQLVEQVELSQVLLLVQLGRGKEAIPFAHNISVYAKDRKLRGLEFGAYLELGQIYQPAGDLTNARTYLEKAESLVRPGPFDDELDNHQVLDVYVRLSNIYRSINLPAKELVAIEKAFLIAFHLKDDNGQQYEVGYLDQRIKDLNIRQLVEERQKAGELVDALEYSYILLARDGIPTKPTDNQSNWQRVLTLPFQIAQQPGGAAALVGILGDVDALVGIEKLSIFDALTRNYVATGADPLLIEEFALKAEAVLKNSTTDVTALRVESTCALAISYSRQSKQVAAVDKIAECLKFAELTKDPQSQSFAAAANLMVQTQIGNIAAAKASLETLLAKAPENPELLIELAMSLVSAKLYDEATVQLAASVRKFLSGGDKKTAAGAYARFAITLNSDSSERARSLQLQALRSAKQLYHEMADRGLEAEGNIALGDYYLRAADNKNALENYNQAIKLAQEIDQREVMAEGFLGSGNTYQAEKDFTKAAAFHLKAAESYRQLKNDLRTTLCLNNLARDYYALGETDKALATLVEAKTTAAGAPPLSQYFVAYALGDFYRTQGQFEKSLASFRQAIEITKQAGDLEHLAYGHLAVAELDTVVGSWEDAVSEAETSLALFQKLSHKNGQALCWAVLTGIYSDRSSSLKDFNRAQESYAKAEEFGYGKALLLDLMEIYLQDGKYSEAAKIAKERNQDCLKEGDADCRAHALLSLAEAERLNRNLRAARTALNEAGPLASKSSDLYLRGRLLYAESRLLASEGSYDKSLSSYRNLISLIESVKGNLDARDQKALSENYSYIYDELVALLYSMNKKATQNPLAFASESLEYAEINKAKQFAASWGRTFVTQMQRSLPVNVQQTERDLFSQRDQIKAEFSADSEGHLPPDRRKELKAKLTTVEDDIAKFLSQLRRDSPQYAAVAYPEPVRIGALPLKSGETFVEFKMTEDATFVWIVQNPKGYSNQLTAFYKVPQTRNWFLERISAIRNALNAARPESVDWKVSEEIFAALFPEDAARILGQSPSIIFVPDDVLFTVPFELFSPNASHNDFVFLHTASVYYPSAASFQLARTATHSATWQSTFLGLADPITSPEDDRFEVAKAIHAGMGHAAGQSEPAAENLTNPVPDASRLKARGFSFERLPSTAVEVRNIAALLQRTDEKVEVRVGIDATKSQLLDTDLSKFRFLHFATHGVLPVDTAVREPSLVLSYDGVAPTNMFLSMSEILALRLQSESVVLSACNTGSGKISRAEGVMSLGRAFLAAGSASVTVSLWQVSDESTAALMAKYYEGLLEGKKKSIALAEARYAVFASGSKNPFFWAPFIVIGE
jgi:CHAT domain-containing protein/tetratricopeptide (TPR) repeat protein